MDAPILFSPAMVRALLDGRKTQTRRLASSPLARRQVGDRLYVREAWRTLQKWDGSKPSHLIDDIGNVTYEADPENRNPLWAFGRYRPAMHMPRWASRLTLIVEDVRIQPLQSIDDGDAKAEGVTWLEPTDEDRKWAAAQAEEDGHPVDMKGVWTVPGMADVGCDVWHVQARLCYGRLWDMLHKAAPHRFDDNPDVVALTFRVEHSNIDLVSA